MQKTIDALKKAASKQARELETTRKLIQDANVSRKDAETQLAMKVNELETTKEQANVLAEVMRRCNAQNDQLRAKLAQLDNNHGELELSRKEARMLREKLGDVVKQYEQQRAGAQRVQKLAFEKIQNEQATKENLQGQLDAKDTEIETAKAGAQKVQRLSFEKIRSLRIELEDELSDVGLLVRDALGSERRRERVRVGVESI